MRQAAAAQLAAAAAAAAGPGAGAGAGASGELLFDEHGNLLESAVDATTDGGVLGSGCAGDVGGPNSLFARAARELRRVVEEPGPAYPDRSVVAGAGYFPSDGLESPAAAAVRVGDGGDGGDGSATSVHALMSAMRQRAWRAERKVYDLISFAEAMCQQVLVLEHRLAAAEGEIVQSRRRS
jgi:hypothetical protein